MNPSLPFHHVCLPQFRCRDTVPRLQLSLPAGAHLPSPRACPPSTLHCSELPETQTGNHLTLPPSTDPPGIKLNSNVWRPKSSTVTHYSLPSSQLSPHPTTLSHALPTFQEDSRSPCTSPSPSSASLTCLLLKTCYSLWPGSNFMFLEDPLKVL